MRIRSHSLLLCLLALASAIPASAEQPWIEVRSPHFRVLTNGSPSDARHVAHEFEEMRYVFATRFPLFRLESGAPLTIFAARDERTAKQLLPGLRKTTPGFTVDGIFLQSWEKQYVMERLDPIGLTPNQVVYHEYTHSILHINFQQLPTWLDEGFADFYGYTRFQLGKIEIGAPTSRASALQGTLIPIETLMYPPANYFRDGHHLEMFYAESWALIHYMIFGDGMEGGAKLNRFFVLLQQGQDQEKAFHQVFGDFSPMDKALAIYMRSLAFHATVLPDSPQITEKQFTTRKLTLAETHAELAGFHIWNQDLPDARPLIASALQEDPKLAIAHEANGFLLFSDGEDAAAHNEFAQAYATDNTLYLSLFAKAMLSPESSSNNPVDQAALYNDLMAVLELNPQFAPAYIQLARLDVRRGKLSAALGLSKKAEELEPSRAGYHLLTGQILLRMGREAEAAETAKYVALRWHYTDRDEAVEIWNKIPSAHRPAGVTFAQESRGELLRIEGTVKSSLCVGPDKEGAIVLTHKGKDLTFHRHGTLDFGFSDTFWWGREHSNTCHHLDGVRAVVFYHPSTDASYAGEVTAIDARDDLPASNDLKIATVQSTSKP